MSTQPRVRYADSRPFVVPDALDQLRGPMRGVVRLPVWLDWSEQRSYDLDDDADSRLMYERVIRETMDIGALLTFLNKALLVTLWPRLFLPARIRAAWESRFPMLAQP